MVKAAPDYDKILWLTMHDAASHEAYGFKQGEASNPLVIEDKPVTIGRMTVDFWERTISQGGKTVQLQDKQWAVFLYLLGFYQQHTSGFVTNKQILKAVWEGIGSPSLVRTTTWRLRSKLESINADMEIENVYGSGRYRLRLRKIK
jgi:DNA-binding response OmpR family regulator